MTWRDQAACLGQPDRMTPEVATRAQVQEAKSLCRGCPVRLQCLTEGEAGEQYGIWGGEWFGEPPRSPLHVVVCGHCGGEFEAAKSSATYCSARCRVAAGRSRAQVA